MTVDQARFRHEALIYGSDEDFLAVAVPFLREGAANGDVTLLGVDPRLQRLALAEVNGAAGAIGLLDGADYLDGPLPALAGSRSMHQRHLDAGARRIRMLGGAPHTPWADWWRYEAAINHLFAETPLWGVCPYDARCTADDVLQDVERTHPHVTAPGRVDPRRLAYEDPATLINGRNRAAGGQLDQTPPDLELADPGPTTARRALEQAAHHTLLEDHDIDTLCLCVAAILANARQHGAPPVRVRVWTAPDHVDVTIRDSGRGPADPFVGLLPGPGGASGDPGTLHTIYLALSSVALYTDEDGFTVRLTQARHA